MQWDNKQPNGLERTQLPIKCFIIKCKPNDNQIREVYFIHHWEFLIQFTIHIRKTINMADKPSSYYVPYIQIKWLITMITSSMFVQYIADLVSKRKERKQICSHVFCHVVVCLLARESIARKLPLRRCPTNQAAVQRNGLLTWTKINMFPTSVRQTKPFSGGRLFWRFQVFIVRIVFSASKREICMVLIWLSWPVCIVPLTKEFYKNPSEQSHIFKNTIVLRTVRCRWKLKV